MTQPSSIPTLDSAFPWLSAGLALSAGASWLVGSGVDAGRITLDVVAVLAAGLVVLVIAIDGVIARIGAGLALVLLCVYAVVAGVVASCLCIAASIDPVWPAFAIAAGLFAAISATSLARRRPVADGGPLAALSLYLEPVNAVLRLIRGVNRFVGDSREDPGWNARHGIPPERRIRPR